MPSPHNPTSHTRPDQITKARSFHALHDTGVLVLPNAWDVASAVLIRDAGTRAVATTSAGASWSLGTPDGEHLTRDRAVDLIARITALVDEPVTTDLEGGYGAEPADVAETTRAALGAGAVGINLEDGAGPTLRGSIEQGERLTAARTAADELGVPLFVNARTDIYLAQIGHEEQRLNATISRAEAYLEAGADGIFVPGLTDPDTISALVRAIPAPINIMAGPGAPTVTELTELTELGVRRVSVGMAIAQATYTFAQRAAREILTQGTYTTLENSLDYATINTALTTPDR